MTGWLDLPREIRQYIYHLKDFSDWETKIKEVNKNIKNANVYIKWVLSGWQAKDNTKDGSYFFYIECVLCGLRGKGKTWMQFNRYFGSICQYRRPSVCNKCYIEK